MAIRCDFYTIYRNREYRVWNNNGLANLVSNKIEDLDNGFIEYDSDGNNNPRIFIKLVSPSEIGDVYEIRTYCLYQGYEFHVVREKNGYYTLETNSTIGMKLIEQLGFERIDKYGYEKTVAKEDLDLIYEKKKLLENYFK